MSSNLKLLKYRLKKFKILLIALGALACAFVVSQFFFSVTFIYGESMEPTFHDKDVTLVNRTAAVKNNLGINDVIVFKHTKISPHLIVKRIVALPGQTVKISDGELTVDGKAVKLVGNPIRTDESMEEITVPKDCYFVLGDNPQKSTDSRDSAFGFVTKDDIVGKIVLKIFPM